MGKILMGLIGFLGLKDAGIGGSTTGDDLGLLGEARGTPTGTAAKDP